MKIASEIKTVRQGPHGQFLQDMIGLKLYLPIKHGTVTERDLLFGTAMPFVDKEHKTTWGIIEREEN